MTSERTTPLSCEDVDTIVEFTTASLPDEVKDALEEIDIQICEDHTDPALEGVTDEEGRPMPPDFRGFYVGTVVEGGDDDEENAEPPKGTIYLNCANLFSESHVVETLYHEIGHALGLSEEEVENLGL